MVAIKSAFLILASAAVAQAMAVSRTTSLSDIIGAVACPKGQTLFHINNNGTVPSTAVGDVWKYIGNFCDPSWQGFTADSTTGTCNTAGSTRTFSLLGLTLTEKLELNVGSSSAPAKWETYFVQVFELLGNPQVLATSVTAVHDLLQVETKGSGTYITWDTVGCSNNTATAEAIFSEVHGGGVATAIAHFAS
ncbi:hypothetical protein Q5752_001093 [Cryptotrichosporon argae]